MLIKNKKFDTSMVRTANCLWVDVENRNKLLSVCSSKKHVRTRIIAAAKIFSFWYMQSVTEIFVIHKHFLHELRIIYFHFFVNLFFEYRWCWPEDNSYQLRHTISWYFFFFSVTYYIYAVLVRNILSDFSCYFETISF
jgi:hypothetical protein